MGKWSYCQMDCQLGIESNGIMKLSGSQVVRLSGDQVVRWLADRSDGQAALWFKI
jgi:hypothetical protein